MLVITPKEGETVEIGPDIRIHIKKVSGRAVRIAIEAPRDLRIRRAGGAEKKDEGGDPR